MTRILVLSDLWRPFPGGAERLMYNISRELMLRGHDLHVFTDYHARQQLDGPPVTWASVGVFENQAAGWKTMSDFIAEYDPEVILTHHLFAYQFERELTNLGVPLVQVLHGARRLPSAAIAVYNTGWTMDQCGDAEPQDMVIVPPAYEDIVADHHEDYIGFINPAPHKGVDLIYELAERMAGHKFLILRHEWVTTLTIRTDLPNVWFMDPVTDMRDFYERVNLVLMPSLTESAGTVAQECALNGIPCITSNVQGLVETNPLGIRLDPPLPERLSEVADDWGVAIAVLDNPQSRAVVIREQRRALDLFDWPAKFDELSERIRRLP